MSEIVTIDCLYLGEPQFAAAYLVREGNRAAFIETNTQRATASMLQMLADRGLAPEHVDYIVVTHVHLDHAGGASALMAACPNATLLCHPRAQPHLVQPEKLVRSAQQVYGAARFSEIYGEITAIAPQRTRVMQDGEQLAWGARTWTFLYTRGHANHHFCIHDSKSNSIFTGDAFGLVYPRLQRDKLLVVPSTSPTDFDAGAARQALETILDSGAHRAYLTHFGPREDLRAIASNLDGQLTRYGAVVERALSDGIHDEQLDAYCRREVDALFDDVLAQADANDWPLAHETLATDRELNAQGVAFAVRKARHKARK